MVEELKRRVLACVNEDEVVEFTKAVCRFPSYSGEETGCANFLAKFMREQGFEVEMQDVEPGRFQTIGRLRGTGEGPSLMFNAHMDIGPVLMHTWTKQDPYEPYVSGSRIHGHGIENMKGGLAAMIMAAVAVKRTGIPLKGDFVVCPVVGELQGGVGSKHLVDHGVITDYALVPEPSDLTVRLATAGCATFLIHTFGLKRRVDATDKMIKVRLALQEANRAKDFTYTYFPGKPDLPLIRIGGIIGGLGRDHSLSRCPPGTPDFCTLGIDVRTVPGQTEESVKKDLERILARQKVNDPDFHFEIEGPPATYTKTWPLFKHFIPAANLSPDAWIVQVVAQNHRYVTGDPAVIWTQPGQFSYDDCGHLQAAGIEAVTYGCKRTDFAYTDGTTEDAMEINQVMTTARVYATSAVDICTRLKT